MSLSGSIQGFNVVQEKVKISKFSKISKKIQIFLKIIKSNLFFLNVQNFQNFKFSKMGAGRLTLRYNQESTA
jgi:hypothetical protein